MVAMMPVVGAKGVDETMLNSQDFPVYPGAHAHVAGATQLPPMPQPPTHTGWQAFPFPEKPDLHLQE